MRLHVTFDSDGELILRDPDAARSDGEEEYAEDGRVVYEFGTVIGPGHTFAATS
jgi:hypothetical protein